MRCNVTSNPGSHIKLLNNSQILRDVTNSKQAEYTWNQAGCLDTGPYTCEARNSIVPSVRQSVQLSVRCSPRRDHRVPFKDRFVTAVGGDVTLTISVIANPTPTFTWYRLSDGTKMNLTSENSTTADVSATGSLALKNVQQKDFGIYQVVVSNGDKNRDFLAKFPLIEEGPTSVPSDVSVWGSGLAVAVAWIEEFNGGLPQTFLVQYRADGTTQWENLTEVFEEIGVKKVHASLISNLQPTARYLVRVLAYNTHGYKGFTHEQEVLTGEEISQKDTSLGTGIGVGITIMTAMLIIVSGIVYTYWWMRNGKPEFGCTKRQSGIVAQENPVYEDLEQNRGDESVTETNASSNYTSLETTKETSFDDLEVYENRSEIKGDESVTETNASSNYTSLEIRKETQFDDLEVYENRSEIKVDKLVTETNASSHYTSLEIRKETSFDDLEVYENRSEIKGDESVTETNASSNYSPLEIRQEKPYDDLEVYENRSEIKE
ncbi:kin of IRRE-like protein 1 [Gigantopelta aegis]|uniref:kin of IRRE-like protein 1 n=1 Tax=Gigantopelta aegis TaxID=1735272 RepID=UPI001B889274|nr:kin of IRRE-like protein 1 [Gigantopelta aegis]